MLPRILATLSLISIGILFAMLTFTTPASAGPFGLLVIFVTAYLSFLGAVSFFLYGAQRFIISLSKGFAARRPLQPMTFRRAYYFSTALAAAPVMFIGLQSVGTIGIYEIILITLFEVVACIYISRRLH